MVVTYKIHSQGVRENQYEIFFDLLEGGKVIRGNQTYFVGIKLLDNAGIAGLMEKAIIPQYTASLEVEPEEEIYTKTEVTDILKEKGYLTAEQSFDDLSINTKG